MKKLSIGMIMFALLVAASQKQAVDEKERTDEEINSRSEVEEVNEKAKEESEIPIDLSSYNNLQPNEWGENVKGVKTSLDTDEKVIALTFDACGGTYGNGYDEKLIDFLREEQIPATLFINERWILEHEQLFLELANDSLFQIENHGTAHVPLTVTGNSAWGIEGTSSPEEVKEEVMGNQETIKRLTGRAPTLFRSGTAYYDEVAVSIVNELGLQVVNFDVLGDAGATYSAEQVHQSLMSASSGSIVLLHMNQPSSGTAAGLRTAVRELKANGFSFVMLEDYKLK